MSRRLRSAFWRVLRSHRAADAEDAPLERAMDTSIPFRGTPPHSSPSMSRDTRLSRDRSCILPPCGLLAAPFIGAELFCGIGAAVVRGAHILHIIVRRPKKGRR